MLIQLLPIVLLIIVNMVLYICFIYSCINTQSCKIHLEVMSPSWKDGLRETNGKQSNPGTKLQDIFVQVHITGVRETCPNLE